jgi:hypothetical protein
MAQAQALRWSMAWRVSVTYVEPTYALRRGIPEIEYQSSFVVVARGAVEATELGRRAFRSACAASGVSWAREIRRVEAVRTMDGWRGTGGESPT